jgi:hypothetical protein
LGVTEGNQTNHPIFSSGLAPFFLHKYENPYVSWFTTYNSRMIMLDERTGFSDEFCGECIKENLFDEGVPQGHDKV